MPFLTLPGEILNQIYEEVLLEDAEISIPLISIHEPGLLLVNSKIRTEAAPIYWSKNTFFISMQNFDSNPLVRLETKLTRLLADNFTGKNFTAQPYQTHHTPNFLKWLERLHSGALKIGYPEPPKGIPIGSELKLLRQYMVSSIFEMMGRHLNDPWEEIQPLAAMQCAEMAMLDQDQAIACLVLPMLQRKARRMRR